MDPFGHFFNSKTLTNYFTLYFINFKSQTLLATLYSSTGNIFLVGVLLANYSCKCVMSSTDVRGLDRPYEMIA